MNFRTWLEMAHVRYVNPQGVDLPIDGEVLQDAFLLDLKIELWPTQTAAQQTDKQRFQGYVQLRQPFFGNLDNGKFMMVDPGRTNFSVTTQPGEPGKQMPDYWTQYLQVMDVNHKLLRDPLH